VKWPCGSVNQREGTSGQFKMQKQQTMLAVLSLGPVGISDQLSGRPSEPGVTTTSNVSLVMSTCAATGDLLQPSYPLTVLDRSLGGQTGDIELWGTYTAVGAASSLGHGGMPAQVEATATLQVWYLAMLFQFGKAQRTPKNGLPSLQVLESDLAPMVDESHVTPSFSDVPVASFANMGTNLTGEYVVWTADFLSTQRSENACAAVTLSAWAGSYNVSVEPQGSLAHLAPVMGVAVVVWLRCWARQARCAPCRPIALPRSRHLRSKCRSRCVASQLSWCSFYMRRRVVGSGLAKRPLPPLVATGVSP
jgi:hypothetical protein